MVRLLFVAMFAGFFITQVGAEEPMVVFVGASVTDLENPLTTRPRGYTRQRHMAFRHWQQSNAFVVSRITGQA